MQRNFVLAGVLFVMMGCFLSPLAAQEQELPYRSALENYRQLDEPTRSSWVDAMQRVGEVGGWREYAREIRALQAAERAAAAQAAAEKAAAEKATMGPTR